MKKNKIDWKWAVLLNFGSLAYVMLPLGFLYMTLKALDTIEFTDPFLKLPFIAILKEEVI